MIIGYKPKGNKTSDGLEPPNVNSSVIKCCEKNRLIKLKIFLKKAFENRIQAFTTKNIVGDYMNTIYDKDGIQVDYTPRYEYIEIFGLTDEEYKELEKEKYIY